MTITQPLDLEKIFLITLAGTPEIFAFLSIIGISVASAFFKFSNVIFLSLLALFVIIMAGHIGGIYLLILLFIGLSSFYGISKVIKT